jgi:hypothetical protein
MTFKDRYSQESTWHGKVTVMEIYHLAMSQRVKGWTISKTAEHFECSIGLVSENLRLAQAIHSDEKFLKCESRQEALKRLNGNYRR